MLLISRSTVVAIVGANGCDGCVWGPLAAAPFPVPRPQTAKQNIRAVHSKKIGIRFIRVILLNLA